MTLGSGGSIAAARDYYPFGGLIREYANGVTDRFKFTEKERDVETNYDYFGARYYSSELGRWLSVDPLAAKYPGWSPYNYCKNNPLILIDPKGMEPKENGKESSGDNWWDKIINLLILNKPDVSTAENVGTQPAVTAINIVSGTVEKGKNNVKKAAVDAAKRTPDAIQKVHDVTSKASTGLAIGGLITSPSIVVGGGFMAASNIAGYFSAGLSFTKATITMDMKDWKQFGVDFTGVATGEISRTFEIFKGVGPEGIERLQNLYGGNNTIINSIITGGF